MKDKSKQTIKPTKFILQGKVGNKWKNLASNSNKEYLELLGEKQFGRFAKRRIL